MSGRLVILRHKSWHVWNQDNQEKVLRDERIHRESEEAKRVDGKRKLSETIYSTLSSGERVEETTVKEDGEPSSTHKRGEKGESGQPSVKRDPILNDWKLGDGSRELSKVAPWYEQVSPQNSSSHFDEQDTKRKKAEDPMAMFCADKGCIESKIAEEDTVVGEATPMAVAAAIENDSESSSDDSRRKKRRKADKRKKSKDSKHKKKDKKKGKSSGAAESSAIDFDALRAKRLEREKLERKREQLLLAEVDVFGTPSYDRVVRRGIP